MFRRTPMQKFNFNRVVEIALRHGCFSVHLLHIFITLYYKNSCEGLFWMSKCNDPTLNWRYGNLPKSWDHGEIKFMDEIYTLSKSICFCRCRKMSPETWKSDTWHLPRRTWHLEPDTWHQLPDAWNLEPDIWHLILGTWYLVHDTLTPDTWNLEPCICVSNLPPTDKNL